MTKIFKKNKKFEQGSLSIDIIAKQL